MVRARKALKAGAYDQALVALDEHARMFPDGELAGERRQSRVKALCLAGRVAMARAVVEKHRETAGTFEAHCGE